VVDPAQLSFDIFANTVSLALPATLWAMLFLLAWEHGPFAESIGFGRWAFWLLLPGALLASFALLPIAPVSNDWVAISFAGALFPLLLGALAFGRVAPPAGRTLGQFLAFLAVESATLLLLVLPVSNPIVIAVASVGLPSADAQILVIAAASAAWTGLALGLFLRNPVGTAPAVGVPSRRALGFTLALTTAVLAGTFAASSAVPGVGIEEQFPVFLLPPLSAGFLASGLAPRVFHGREGFALPSAYFATTFGVLLGADLLRQPPLYGNGPSGLYTIGGAGVLDLVYLSGLIALLAAYLGTSPTGVVSHRWEAVRARRSLPRSACSVDRSARASEGSWRRRSRPRPRPVERRPPRRAGYWKCRNLRPTDLGRDCRYRGGSSPTTPILTRWRRPAPRTRARDFEPGSRPAGSSTWAESWEPDGSGPSGPGPWDS